MIKNTPALNIELWFYPIENISTYRLNGPNLFVFFFFPLVSFLFVFLWSFFIKETLNNKTCYYRLFWRVDPLLLYTVCFMISTPKTLWKKIIFVFLCTFSFSFCFSSRKKKACYLWGFWTKISKISNLKSIFKPIRKFSHWTATIKKYL